MQFRVSHRHDLLAPLGVSDPAQVVIRAAVGGPAQAVHDFVDAVGGNEALPAFKNQGVALRFAAQLEMHSRAGAGLQLGLGSHEAADQVGHFGDGAVAVTDGAHVPGRAVDINLVAIAFALEIVVPRDHRFAGRGVGHFRLVAVEADVGSQTGFEAIAYKQFGLSAGRAIKPDGEADLAANAAGMLAERTNDAVAGLDGALGKEPVAALGANGRALLFHFLIDEGEHLEQGGRWRRLEVGAIPDRAAVGRVELQVGAFADKDAVVKLLQVAVEGEREGAVAAGFLLDDQHGHHIPVPLQPGFGHHLGKHLERGDDAHRRPFIVARAASIDGAAFDARGEVRRHDINVGVESHRLPGLAAGCPGDHTDQVGPVGIGLFRGEPLRTLRSPGEMQQGVIRVGLDARIDRPALEPRAGEAEAAQLPFENTEATVLSGLHPCDVRVRRSVNLAQLDQQVPQVTLEAGGPRPGEDFANDGRRG